MLTNDVREVFGMALLTLGYSGNSSNPEEIKAAYDKLTTLMSNVKTMKILKLQDIFVPYIGMFLNDFCTEW